MSSATFTGLPRELRNRIYDLLYACERVLPYTDDDGTKRIFLCNSHFPDTIEPQVILALLLVSHEISAEAASAFYGKLKFGEYTLDLVDFLNGIGQERRSLVKSVYLIGSIASPSRMSCPFDQARKVIQSDAAIFILLGGLKNLQTIEIISRGTQDFEKVRRTLVEKGIQQLVGHVGISVVMEILVTHTVGGGCSRDFVPYATWVCPRGTAEFKEEKGESSSREVGRITGEFASSEISLIYMGRASATS